MQSSLKLDDYHGPLKQAVRAGIGQWIAVVDGSAWQIAESACECVALHSLHGWVLEGQAIPSQRTSEEFLRGACLRCVATTCSTLANTRDQALVYRGLFIHVLPCS